MDLIEAIRQSETAERAEALAIYRECLLRHAEPERTDPKRLAAAMRSLGKSAADLNHDLGVIQEHARLENAVSAGEDPGLREAAAAAGAAFREYMEETERIVRQREDKKRELFQEVRNFQRRQSDAHAAERKLAEHERTHWRLLGLPEPAREARPEPRTLVGATTGLVAPRR